MVAAEESRRRAPDPTACLSETQALDYALGASEGNQGALIREHILACGRCRVMVAEAARGSAERPLVERKRTFADGERVADRYTIVRLLGRGGMGEVYEAEDGLLAHTIALKTLTVGAGGDGRAIRRLKDEVLLARRVSHVNVCRIMEFGVHVPAGADDSVPFLTMEKLDGETLGARLRRETSLAPRTAAVVALQIVDGLGAIHASGIVHRDLKSDNVFLARDAGGNDRVVLLDFGLARTLEPTGHHPPLTAGGVVGTIEYMAPEQIEGTNPTVAFDVFALGVVLCEMLTGRRPWSGATALAAAAKRMSEPPLRPSDLAPGLDRAWDRLVHGCLRRDPLQRYPGAAPIRAAIEGIVNTAPASPRTSSRRFRPAVLALAAGALAVGAFILRETPRPGRPVARKPGMAGDPAAMAARPAATERGARANAEASAEGKAHLPGKPAPSREGAAGTGENQPPEFERPRSTARAHGTARPRSLLADRGRERTPAAITTPPLASVPGTVPAMAEQPEAAAVQAPRPPFGAGPQANLEAAQQLLLNGKPIEACRAAEEAKRSGSTDPALYHFLGRCYMRQGSTALAKANFRRYLQLAPDASDAAIVRKIVE
jgi:hypothetical protein